MVARMLLPLVSLPAYNFVVVLVAVVLVVVIVIFTPFEHTPLHAAPPTVAFTVASCQQRLLNVTLRICQQPL